MGDLRKAIPVSGRISAARFLPAPGASTAGTFAASATPTAGRGRCCAMPAMPTRALDRLTRKAGL